MMDATTSDQADIQVEIVAKQAQRAAWASGDYSAVARDLVSPLGERLVEACGAEKGAWVLDVAAGTGNASIPAALRGARVVACDLSGELCAEGWRESQRRGVDIFWHEADAEDLPYDDEEFDVVMSCLGAMFVSRQDRAAQEIVRVTRPGGRIGLLNWTPNGFLGEVSQVLQPYAAAGDAGALGPSLWGDAAHVTSLLGPYVHDVMAANQTLEISRFATPRAVLEYFKRHYGPVASVYRMLQYDPALTWALDDELLRAVEAYVDIQDGRMVMSWEYLLLTARRL